MKKIIRKRLSTKCTALLLIMAMLFSVTCVFPSYSEGEATSRSLASGTSFSDGVYVLNNRLTGQFLSSNGSSLSMTSNTTATVSNTVKFSINYVAGGCYDIRVNSNFYCLTRSTTTSNKNITLSPSLNGQYSLWRIGTYTVNNYTYHYFQNVQTNEYLTWQNGTLKVTSSLGTPATSSFYACMWRVVKSAEYTQLTSVSIDDMWLPYGASEPPVITATPGYANFCAPHDFTYTCDTSYVGVDTLEGYITPNNYTGSYTKTITATHKPTGIQTTFDLTMNPKGFMLAVTATDNRDRTSGLSVAIQHLTNSGYTGGYLAEGSFTVAQVNEFLDDSSFGEVPEDYTYNVNSVFVSRSHGFWNTNASDVIIGTKIKIDERNNTWYSSENIPSTLDLSNMRIVVFGGCYTGLGGAAGNNLPSVVVELGARVAIGFQVEISVGMANAWVERFFYLLSDGRTVQEAVETINNEDYTNPSSQEGEPYSTMKPYIAGDGSVTLY